MKKLLLVFGLIFLVNSCDDNMSYKQEMSDMQLIEAIASDPNKFEIDEVDVPAMSLFSIGEEYYDYMMYKAEISPEYGYQISLGDMALDAGDMTEIFFSKDGRKLGGRDGMDERKRHKKRCFKFVFPLTFNLGETSHTVNDYKEFHAAMKAHYEATGVKEKPAFAYPIQIEFRGEDTETATINSDDELKMAVEQTPKVFQLFKKYIVTSTRSGSLIINQKRAHQRGLSEAFLSSITEKKINSQQLMFPKELELSTKQLALFDDFEDNLKAMGFISERHNTKLMIIGTPSICDDHQVECSRANDG